MGVLTLSTGSSSGIEGDIMSDVFQFWNILTNPGNETKLKKGIVTESNYIILLKLFSHVILGLTDCIVHFVLLWPLFLLVIETR